MSDWAAVVLVLGLCGLAVAIYGVRALVGIRESTLDAKTLRASLEAQAHLIASVDARVRKVETMLKLDGQKIMAEASRANLPAMMR